MSELAVGQWAKRPRGKWHLCESVVAGDVITKCGRRMDRVASRGDLQVSDVMPLTRMIGQPQLCRAGCQARNPDGEAWERAQAMQSKVVVDDDASTHDESEPA